jgi:hypothetical protein
MILGYYIERDGRFLGATGWMADHRCALRFESDAAASDGIDEMRGAHPRLLAGAVRVVTRETDVQQGRGTVVSSYDPFGFGA